MSGYKVLIHYSLVKTLSYVCEPHIKLCGSLCFRDICSCVCVCAYHWQPLSCEHPLAKKLYCIYVAVGQKRSTIAQLVKRLTDAGKGAPAVVLCTILVRFLWWHCRVWRSIVAKFLTGELWVIHACICAEAIFKLQLAHWSVLIALGASRFSRSYCYRPFVDCWYELLSRQLFVSMLTVGSCWVLRSVCWWR